MSLYFRVNEDIRIDLSVSMSAYCKLDTSLVQLAPTEHFVIVDHAGSTNMAKMFVSIFCYGYRDIIFEVMPNNYIASDKLYHPVPHSKWAYAIGSNTSIVSNSTQNLLQVTWLTCSGTDPSYCRISVSGRRQLANSFCLKSSELNVLLKHQKNLLTNVN